MPLPKRRIETRINQIKEPINYSKLIVDDIREIKFEPGDMIIVTFDSQGEIIPKARFNFNINPEDTVLYTPTNPTSGNIWFNLGNRYQCVSPCIYSLRNVNEASDSFDGDIRLIWQVNHTDQTNSFYINTFDRTIKFWKDLLLALGSSLFIAAIVEFIGMIRVGSPKIEEFLNGGLKVKGIGETLLKRIKETINK